MQLVEFRTYVEAAEKLINENPAGTEARGAGVVGGPVRHR